MIETKLVQWLNEAGLFPEAFMDVPADRPARFITVERTGGTVSRFRDDATLAVQVWDTSRVLAAETAKDLADNLYLLALEPFVGRVRVNGLYNFPAETSSHARYQITVEIQTVTT